MPYHIYSKLYFRVYSLKDCLNMASKRRCCHNDQNVFCYICGEYMKKEHRFNVRDLPKVPTKRTLASSLEIRISLGLPIKCAKIALNTSLLDPRKGQSNEIWSTYGLAGTHEPP